MYDFGLRALKRVGENNFVYAAIILVHLPLGKWEI
jgi:hypothetical protein